MGTILFLLLFFFVLLPLGRVAWAFWRQYRAVKRQFRQAFGGREEAAGARSRQQPDTPPVKKKKIARDVGEYVAFEEIRTYTETDDHTEYTEYTSTRVESQVEDADWEEIKQ
ncbi:MAG: DUF4834 family protein [Muribaculaceae bacterium]|nr:DUF4834 family protein [Muribaculaceae bacterium]